MATFTGSKTIVFLGNH